MTAAGERVEPARASLAGFLAPLADPLLDPRLLAGAAWSRCLAVAGAIPGAAAFGMVGLEVRLGDDPAVDLLVYALRAAGGPRWLHAVTTQQGDASAGRWAAIDAFAQAWDDGPLSDRLDRVWLEFDSARRSRSGGARLPAPSVFASPYPAEVDRGAATPDLRAATDMLELLLAGRLPPGVAGTLTQLERALPSESRILQLGAMLSRSRRAVRICVSGPGRDGVQAVLGRLRWPGPASEVECLLASVGRLPRAVCLDLDLTPSGLGATVGIEVYANAPGEPADASRWPPLLDRLEDRELVRPAKRAALDTYPRVQVSTGLLDKLPLPYARAATLLAAQRTGRFIAHLHHVKVTLSDGGPPTAKAYLGLWHEWS
jgi:hypothetical protein